MSIILYKFDREDRGNVRTYYRREGRLFCLQYEGFESTVFYRCSRDGEPDSPIAMPSSDQFDRLVMPS